MQTKTTYHTTDDTQRCLPRNVTRQESWLSHALRCVYNGCNPETATAVRRFDLVHTSTGSNIIDTKCPIYV
jgi:hypothetical protein